MKNAQDYDTLSKAIGIHILNFTSIPNVDKYHNVFHITEKKSGVLYFKDLELHTIELKKFNSNPIAELSEIVSKITTSLDRWVAFLTRHDLLEQDHLPEVLNDHSIKKALNVLDVMGFNPEEREAYENHLKWLRIESNTLKKSEQKGREEGIEIGIHKGKVEVAKSLLELGFSLEVIAKSTGLSILEIEQLD